MCALAVVYCSDRGTSPHVRDALEHGYFEASPQMTNQGRRSQRGFTSYLLHINLREIAACGLQTGAVFA